MLIPSYKALKQNKWTKGAYSLVPIRMEDRYDIMKWRNEQIYHLRQSEPLTKEKQDWYFENVVAKLFDQEKPEQLLFSFLEGKICIGYGGLVHINWTDLNAEISFVMATELEKLYFEKYWVIFLGVLEKVAFKCLNFHKIYTYAYDLRPRLYKALRKAKFKKEARFSEHCLINNDFKDVLIHTKFNPLHKINFRKATSEDAQLLYDWANAPLVRKNAFNSEAIAWESHLKWLANKLLDENCKIYIFSLEGQPVGQVRVEFDDNFWKIDYSVDSKYRGQGIGGAMIKELIKKEKLIPLLAEVKHNNLPSIRVFEKLSFVKEVKKDISGKENNNVLTYTYNA